jgi:phage tail sheath protein FI
LGSSFVSALGLGEGDAPGFGALYHGWLATRDDDGEVRIVAPDGAASGVIARRALERGAWIAPANESLRSVIALSRPSAGNRLQSLQDAGINVVLQAPRGFTIMCADTMSPDDEVRPINVRRLLILLRRQALRLGTTYVFEPNDDAFRRMVQRGFEAMLGGLFERGAFAGDTTATAFQVRTDASLNTSVSIDQGRFIVELRVAPARPLTFVTLRLVQVGERLTLTGA